MDKKIEIRIDDYEKIREAHDKIVAIINEYQMTAFNVIGLLETIKSQVLMREDD